MRTVEFREDLLAGHSFEVRADRLDGIDAEAPGPRFADGALRDLFAVRAPQLDLDAVLLLERLGERTRLARCERGVEHDDALPPGVFQNALIAVGAAIQVQCLVSRLRRLGMR